MFTIERIVQPDSVASALEHLRANRRNIILGGTTFLKMSDANYKTGIDLTRLALNRIEDTGDMIRCGAMVSYGELENHPAINTYYPALVQALRGIVGRAFRNSVTLGASVFARYGFSDIIPVLVAADAKLLLAEQGEVTLETFIGQARQRDILLEVVLPKVKRRQSYYAFRQSTGDFSLINLALWRDADDYRIVVGARPGGSQLLPRVANTCRAGADYDKLRSVLADECVTHGNLRASADYRLQLAKVGLIQCLNEVGYEYNA